MIEPLRITRGSTFMSFLCVESCRVAVAHPQAVEVQSLAACSQGAALRDPTERDLSGQTHNKTNVCYKVGPSTSSKWSYNPYKWVIGVITLLIEVKISNDFYFFPYLGKMTPFWHILTNVIQLGWNHQLEKCVLGLGVIHLRNHRIFDLRWSRIPPPPKQNIQYALKIDSPMLVALQTWKTTESISKTQKKYTNNIMFFAHLQLPPPYLFAKYMMYIYIYIPWRIHVFSNPWKSSTNMSWLPFDLGPMDSPRRNSSETFVIFRSCEVWDLVTGEGVWKLQGVTAYTLEDEGLEPTAITHEKKGTWSSKPPWGHVPAVNLQGCKITIKWDTKSNQQTHMKPKECVVWKLKRLLLFRLGVISGSMFSFRGCIYHENSSQTFGAWVESFATCKF